ncbi:uncharacterized protein LDX57_006074 [Aspergillus melleus]|nr:uncharacterized protein LDX57_006074 [Aspergillus melleus]KAH8428374.1 hypothetical protein LDX57_006074 [Aspergillus melleus]
MASLDTKDIEGVPNWNATDSTEKQLEDEKAPPSLENDPFGAEEIAEVKYKTLDWW